MTKLTKKDLTIIAIASSSSGGGGGAGGTDKGTWNPKTNTPNIFTLLTNSGEFAIIDGLEAGETYNFDFGGTKGGIVAFSIGDKVYFNGVIFQKQETYIPTADEIIYDKTNPILGSVKDVVDLKANSSDVYTKTEVNTSLDLKANQSTTYTKTEVDTALNLKENTITAGTTSQYFRGDKTFQTLDKSAVGLANVDNTSDLNKPISTATQNALDLKANITDVNTSLALKEDKVNKGVANGYAGLDATGKVPSTQLPNIASSIATLSDVALGQLNNNDVLVYNTSLTKWENKSIQDVAGGEVVPIGSIQAFYSNTIPAGYLLCNGSTFNAVDYPDLNTFLGSNILPDLRGYFLRGLGGVDPDAGTRTLGSIQQDEFKSHAHKVMTDEVSAGTPLQSLYNTGGSDQQYRDLTDTAGGLETRPKNIAVNYIIKAKHNPASAYNLVAGADISITTDEVNKTATISSTGYTDAQIDTALNLKANQSTTYTKVEVNNLINIQNLINYSFNY